MKRLFVLAIISTLSVLLVQCSSSKKTVSKSGTEPKAEDPIVSEIRRNYTPAQMEEGKTIWEGKCIKCHKLYDPANYTVPKMEAILISMIPKAKLSQEDAGKVRAYLLTHAKS